MTFARDHESRGYIYIYVTFCWIMQAGLMFKYPLSI